MSQQEVIDEIKRKLTDKLRLVGEIVASKAKQNIVDKDAVDTGRLLNSIEFEVDDDTVRIGSNVEYSSYVELGTYKQQPRPFLREAVYNNLEEIKQVLTK